ncbi:HIT family protein [Leptospira sp. GIMC2001]|uniref:HIT family protein n=1 Tax=Leptospira sp. GIMC2001 TaxID=1513297 RepID=UPI002349EFE4|nr:HIT family hydrolase [Leptospira sp. GIMC2001]WCL48625.1 HIT family hydrolase [Leptospira sp. GIMC2001]
METNNCPICHTHKSENIEKFLSSTNHWILREADSNKNIEGYLYLEPRLHVTSFDQIDPLAYAELGGLIEAGMQLIYKKYNPLKVYLVTISEAVPHIHFHLVPRYQEEIKGLDYLGQALSGKWKSSNK